MSVYFIFTGQQQKELQIVAKLQFMPGQGDKCQPGKLVNSSVTTQKSQDYAYFAVKCVIDTYFGHLVVELLLSLANENDTTRTDTQNSSRIIKSECVFPDICLL